MIAHLLIFRNFNYNIEGLDCCLKLKKKAHLLFVKALNCISESSSANGTASDVITRRNKDGQKKSSVRKSLLRHTVRDHLITFP